MRWLLPALLAAMLLLDVACFGGSSKRPANAVATDPAGASLSRGLQALTAGHTDDAIAAFRQTLVLDPRNKYAYYNLGLIDQNSGQATNAEGNYRLALAIDPSYEPALFNLAILRTAAGAPQEAMDLYRRIIAMQPDNAGAHLNLGVLLRQNGQQAAGDAEVALALKLDPRLRATPGAVPASPAAR